VNTVEMRSTGAIGAAARRVRLPLVDNLLKEARAHQVRLVLLWFGTWKNGSQHTCRVAKLTPRAFRT